MEFEPERRPRAAAPAAFLSAAFLIWFGYGLEPRWPLLWFAFLPVLLFALRSSAGLSFAVAGFAWLAGCANFRPYFQTLGTPFAAWLAIFSFSAAIFGSAVCLFRALALRGAAWSGLLAFPAAWVSFEYVRNLATPHGTAGSIAYTQLEFPPFLQLASVTGPWGMSFVMCLLPAGCALGLHLWRRDRGQALRIVAAGVAALLLALAYGTVRLSTPAAGETVRVGLIAADEPAAAPLAAEGDATASLLREYALAAGKLARGGARAIVLPEKIGVLAGPASREPDEWFQRIAAETGSVIVVSNLWVSGGDRCNRARIYSAGKPPRDYDKQHMLPPFESNLKPGTSITPISAGAARWGVAICKDMDFTEPSRQYGQAGAGLLLVPAWDFGIDRAWHGHIAVMRGVENGFSVARAARTGNLTVSDDRGRILAEVRSDAAPLATLMADVPVSHRTTLYARLGDWVAWAALAALVSGVGRLFRRARTGPDRRA